VAGITITTAIGEICACSFNGPAICGLVSHMQSEC
jgi:hypothetical protein